jgi:hypothetical protein
LRRRRMRGASHKENRQRDGCEKAHHEPSL